MLRFVAIPPSRNNFGARINAEGILEASTREEAEIEAQKKYPGCRVEVRGMPDASSGSTELLGQIPGIQRLTDEDLKRMAWGGQSVG